MIYSVLGSVLSFFILIPLNVVTTIVSFFVNIAMYFTAKATSRSLSKANQLRKRRHATEKASKDDTIPATETKAFESDKTEAVANVSTQNKQPD